MTEKEYGKVQDLTAVVNEIRSDISDARGMTTCFCFNDGFVDVKKFELVDECYEAIFRAIDNWWTYQVKIIASEESK